MLQGYLFGKLLAAEAFALLLQEGQVLSRPAFHNDVCSTIGRGTLPS